MQCIQGKTKSNKGCQSTERKNNRLGERKERKTRLSIFLSEKSTEISTEKKRKTNCSQIKKLINYSL